MMIAMSKTNQNISEQRLANLLAVIHQDGGHYQAHHGDAIAVLDAQAEVFRLRESTSELKTEIERLKPLIYRKPPCHAFCESTAFQSKINQLESENKKLRALVDNLCAENDTTKTN